MWILRFQRSDQQPDEEYYYQSKAAAVHHMNLFRCDDSGLYQRIDLLQWENPEDIIKSIHFN